MHSLGAIGLLSFSFDGNSVHSIGFYVSYKCRSISTRSYLSDNVDVDDKDDTKYHRISSIQSTPFYHFLSSNDDRKSNKVIQVARNSLYRVSSKLNI